MLKFKPNRMALALLASGAMAVSFPALAAEAEVATEETKSEKVLKDKEKGVTVTVTGFRESLQKSAAMKKNEISVVETLSAEDIGKLPDVSIAESLARLPGVAAQRLDGRANVITIRGMGPDFNTTTLNGREQVSINDSRGVEFDQYPSEMINELVVYKTTNASLAAPQGVGGTVDMRTIRPLQHGQQTIKVNARYENNSLGKLNPDGSDTGSRLSGTFIDQFADNTLGVALNVTSMDSPNQEERWAAWGYPDDGNGNLVLGGAKPYVRSSELKRLSGMAVIEWMPNDSYAMTFDAFYADFEDKQILRGIEIPVWWGQGWSNDSVDVLASNNELVTQGQINNSFVQVRNDFNFRDAELQAFGLNNVFTLDGGWEVEADFAYSKADRADWGMESYAGTGRGSGVGIGDTIGFTMNGTRGATFDPSIDYTDPSVILLGGNLSWGNGLTVPSDGQDGFVNNPWVQDEMETLRLSARKELNSDIFSGYELGINFSDRSKFKRDQGNFLTLNAYPSMLAVPQEFLLAPTSLGFIGMGNMLSYDSLALYNAGYYTETSENATVGSRATNSWDVNEEVTTLFFKVDIDTVWGQKPVRGDFGLQVVDTKQSSVGNAVRSENGFVIRDTNVGGVSYTEVLPSVNLTMEVAEDNLLRFGLSRTLARPQMDQMNASFGFNYEANPTGGNPHFTGGGGNPSLRPIISDNLDLSYEKYFDEGYFSAALYYKHFENWVYDGAVVMDYADFVPQGATPSSTLGTYSQPMNSSGGNLFGGEFTLNLPLSMVTESLDGFGVVANFAYVDSEVQQEPGAPKTAIEGLSRKTSNLTAYYENNGWAVRASARHRSDFLGEVTAISLTRVLVDVRAETVVDAQISYDFGEAGNTNLDGLSIFLQATNLTDEPFVTYMNGDTRQIRDHQVYGRNIMLGVGYDF